MKIVAMELTWSKAKIEGRVPPPEAGRYSTVAKFPDIAEKWPREAWSVVIEIRMTEKSARNWRAVGALHFLVDGAPEELLYEGGQFELYEGKVMTASGVILGDMPDCP